MIRDDVLNALAHIQNSLPEGAAAEAALISYCRLAYLDKRMDEKGVVDQLEKMIPWLGDQAEVSGIPAFVADMKER